MAIASPPFLPQRRLSSVEPELETPQPHAAVPNVSPCSRRACTALFHPPPQGRPNATGAAMCPRSGNAPVAANTRTRQMNASQFRCLQKLFSKKSTEFQKIGTKRAPFGPIYRCTLLSIHILPRSHPASRSQRGKTNSSTNPGHFRTYRSSLYFLALLASWRLKIL